MSGISTYYSYSKILSYNAVYNFIVGPRGNGKTYGAKAHVIKAFLKKGDQFIYLRRYKDELRGRFSFFADIAHQFPDYDFRVNGMVAECSPVSERETKKREWFTMGYFISLSTSQARKGESYPMVKTIIFDEFIIEKGSLHYIQSEARVMNDFYSTVDRYKDKTRVLFLANSISITNPYFLEYEIRPDAMGDMFTLNDGFIACHFPNSEAFTGEVYATRFGKFIMSTEYGQYSVEGVFKDSGDNLIGLKNSAANYRYTIEAKETTFSVWYDAMDNIYYVQSKRPAKENIITLIPEKHREGVELVKINDKQLQFMRTAFRKGRMYFDAPRTRNAFIEIFKG